MPTQDVHLGPGHHRLNGRLDEIFPDISAEDHYVHLVSTVLGLEAPATSPSTPLPETTLDIRMEPQAAMRLLASLERLAQRMDWPRPK